MEPENNYPAIPQQQPVPVRPVYTAVPIPSPEDKEEEEEQALVGWVKSNIFAIIGLVASLLTLYASSQVKPLTQELTHQKEAILEIKTVQAQVLGIMDTKYANKEVTEIQYENLQRSVNDLNESVKGLTELLIKEKK